MHRCVALLYSLIGDWAFIMWQMEANFSLLSGISNTLKLMSNNNQDHNKQKPRLSFFELITEVIGWLQIAVSPLLISIIIGALIYASRPDSTGLVIAISIVAAGLLAGIIWATKVWRKKRNRSLYVSRYCKA